MRTPKQKSKYRGTGFVAQVSVLVFAAICCLGVCCSFTHAWFVTERGVDENQVELATYEITVYDATGNELTDGKYLCPLAPEDLHYFTLQAAGTAYTGHCAVTVAVPGQSEVSYTMELAPAQDGTVRLQAAVGSELTFSFDWGEGENPVEPASVFGSENTLSFYIESTRTPHLSYKVAYGASPAGIAAYYGVSVEDLCAYNGLDAAAANLPVYPGQGETLTYDIPYVETHPVSGPYVPKGDLVLTLVDAGDAATPGDACVLITGPNGYIKQVWYGDFVSGSCTLEDLPVGEYRFTMGNTERENYTLETAVFENGIPETAEIMEASVSEDAVAEYSIWNTYTRHVGELMLWLETSDAKVAIPDDAKVTVYGPDNTVCEMYYNQFDDGSYYLSDLPTGQYTVVLSGAEVKYYDLSKAKTTLTVNRDQVTYTGLTVEYKRQVGNMKVELVTRGHNIPDDVYVAVYGPDDYYLEIPGKNLKKGAFCLEGVFAGEYVAMLMGAAVDDYDLSTAEVEVTVTKGATAETVIFAEYKQHQGNVTVQVIAEGHAVPGDARVILTGSDDTRYEIFYKAFLKGVYAMSDIPVGTYTVELVDAGVNGYDLTVNMLPVTVKKSETSIALVTAAYQRQVGDLEIAVEVSGAELPAEALLTVAGPDGYSQSVACASYTLTGLPTGDYTVGAVGFELDGYTAAVTGGTVSVTKTGASVNVSIVYTAVEPETE